MAAPVLISSPPNPAGDPGRRAHHPRRWRGAAALALGLLAAAAFAPLAWAPLSVAAVAGLALICRDVPLRTGARLGFVFGLAFFLPLLHWSSTFVGAPPWLLLCVSQAAFGVLLGAGLTAVSRLPFWPAWAAGVWVAEELLRSRMPFGGFPWGRLAFSAAGTPFAPYASVGGAPLVTFLVALCGTLLAAAILSWRGPTRRRWALGAGGLAALIPAAGLAIPLPTAGESGSGPATATIAVVQGNVPGSGLDTATEDRAVLRMHVAETVRLANRVAAGSAPRPDAVIWPENASDIDPYSDAAARELIGSAARAVQAPILVGAVLDAGVNVRNTGIVWDPITGPGAVYDKRRPVPFGEYIPLRSLARKFSAKVELVPRDFLAGSRPGVLDVGPVRLADVICFEIALDDVVRDAIRGGGRLLVVQTNNATFGRSAETAQQLAMSRIRAVEHGRAVLVSATTGVSAIIAPDGSVSARSAMFTPATLIGTVPLRDSRTIADRVGAGPEWLLGGLGLAAAVLGALRRRQPAVRR